MSLKSMRKTDQKGPERQIDGWPQPVYKSTRLPVGNLPTDNLPTDNLPTDNLPYRNLPKEKTYCVDFFHGKIQEKENALRKSPGGKSERKNPRKIPGGKVQKENPRGKIHGKENPRLG